MELTEAINRRRSIRRFTGHYVTNRELKDIMEAARQAPSWGNTQCWEFIIVRDTEIIRQITETYPEKNPARAGSLEVSALIIGCANVGAAGYKKGYPVTKFHGWFMFDLGLAVQNLCLKAHELGRERSSWDTLIMINAKKCWRSRRVSRWWFPYLWAGRLTMPSPPPEEGS